MRRFGLPITASALILTLLVTGSTPGRADSLLSPAAMDEAVAKGLETMAGEQAADGSWTGLVETSSVMYTAQTVFFYEFLNQVEQKKATVDGMLRYIWTQQSPSGGFAGFPGGPDNLGISVEAYLAAKIAGESEDSARMVRLENYIQANGGLKKAKIASLFLMLFEIDTNGSCVSGSIESLLLQLDHKLPWLRIMLYPFVHLYATGHTHKLSPAKYPKRLGRTGFCPRWMPHPLRFLHIGTKRFYKWIDAHMNEDGTLFDYAPTSIPALMAISTGPARYRPLLEKGIRTIESFQKRTGDQVVQSPGEASIGETYWIMHSLLDLGYTGQDPMMAKAEKFLLSMQQPETGAFGFSKHNTHFPDADDTSNSVYALKRLANLRGDHRDDARFAKALDWIMGIQNPDGGFGTWERDHAPWLSRLFNRMLQNRRFDLSVSGAEQTARITLNLSLFKDGNPKAKEAYDKALGWLLRQQQADGSYSAIWIVNYVFCTATVLTTFGGAAGDPRIDAAIEKGLQFVLDHQAADGGFSESPASFDVEHAVPLAESSPAQTGLIASELLMFLQEENYRHWDVLKAPLQKAVAFLLRTQKPDGLWHDPAWTGVTFPKLEYLIYPYLQEIAELQAVGMYRRAVWRREGQAEAGRLRLRPEPGVAK